MSNMINKRSFLKLLSLCILCFIIGSAFTQATTTNTFTITTGVYPGSTSYIIYREGSTYYAKNQYGFNDYSSTDATTLLTSVVASNRFIRIADNTQIVITNQNGLSFTGLKNFRLDGGAGSVIRQQYTGAASQIFAFANCENIQVNNIIFDQERNGTVTYSGTLGTQWIVTVGGNLGSSNIQFNNDQFLNAPDCGLVSGAVNNLLINNCVFDNIGEHPIYLSGEQGSGTGVNNLIVQNSQLTNWAQQVRGYGLKLQYAYSMTLQNLYLEANKNGLGNAASGGEGANGVVLSYVKGAAINNVNITGHGTANERSGLYIDQGNNNIIVNNLKQTNAGALTVNNQNRQTNYYSISNSYFLNASIVKFPTDFINNKVLGVQSMTIVSNDICFKDNTVDLNGISNTAFVLTITGNNSQIINNKWYGVTYRGIDTHTSYRTVIEGNLFPNGVSSTWLYPGFRTRIISNTWLDGSAAYAISTGGGSNCVLTNNDFALLSVDIVASGFDIINSNIGSHAPTVKP